MNLITQPELKIAYARARDFHRSTGLDFDELLSVALESYVKSMQKFDVERNVKQSTFVFTAVTNALINYCRKKKRIRYFPTTDKLMADVASDVRNIFSLEMNISQFPKRLQEMLRIIFTNAELFDFSHPKKNKMVLKQLLLQNGWKPFWILRSIIAMKEILANTTENELFV